MTEWLSWAWIGSWRETYKTDYLYDSNGTLITEFNLLRNVAWDSLSRIDYSYLEGKLSRLVFRNYEGSGWTDSFRHSYRYYENGDVKSILDENYRNDTWNYRYMRIFYYSCSNMNILLQTWRDNGWQDSLNTDFFYNEQGDLDSTVARQWDGNYWVNDMKLEVTNDNNHNQIRRTQKYWENNDWQNLFKYDYIFNELHYIENAHCNAWVGGQWVEDDGIIYFENPDGFLTSFFGNNAAVYYNGAAGIDDAPEIQNLDYVLFQNYPNPFNPATTIRYQIPISGFVELNIYDILGKVVAVLVNEYKTRGTYEVTFAARDLPSGVYFYRMRVGSYTKVEKMILQK